MLPPDELAPRLERSLRIRQAAGLPSLAAAVVRDGEVIWSAAVGLADIEAGIEASPATQYRIGSITKTFTAVAIMQLRDEGKLELDDRIEQHLPGIANGSPTLRRMLAHISGLQREPGEMFVTGRPPGMAEMIEAMSGFELVIPAARAHHYSNLAYGLLGEVVTRLGAMPYASYVDERILAPAGLARTTWREQEPRAVGYLVDEYAGTAGREPHIDLGDIAPMGQLWSTVDDLTRWVAMLAVGRDGILAPDTADELWSPQVMLNPDEWKSAWGFGLELMNSEGRIFGGHSGAMPGFLAAMFLNRETKTGAVVLTNSGTRAPIGEIALELAGATIELWPPAVEPWSVEEPPPAEVAALLGRWWSEGYEFVFSWREGKLTAEPAGARAARAKPAVFEPAADGGYRVVSGRERGERLRVDGDRLIWAGYPFTRRQEATPG